MEIDEPVKLAGEPGIWGGKRLKVNRVTDPILQ